MTSDEADSSPPPHEASASPWDHPLMRSVYWFIVDLAFRVLYNLCSTSLIIIKWFEVARTSTEFRVKSD
jgi:hypothetical protein